MIPTPIDNHEVGAVANLTDAYRNTTVITGLVRVFSRRWNLVEAILWDVINSRNLDDASGHELDVLGEFVKEPRSGRSDLAYRVLIRLKIFTLRTNGRAEDVIKFGMLTGATEQTYREMYPAALNLALYQINGARDVARLLATVRPAGVLGSLEYTSGAPNTYMRFGSDYGTGHGNGGFGYETGSHGLPMGGAFQT